MKSELLHKLYPLVYSFTHRGRGSSVCFPVTSCSSETFIRESTQRGRETEDQDFSTAGNPNQAAAD